MAQSASKIFTELGTITAGSFTDTAGGYFGSGTITMKYFKTGKLYFGFYLLGPGNTPIGTVGRNGSTGPTADTLARIATKLGITIDTSYTSSPVTSGANDTYFGWDTGSSFWTGGANTNNQERILAILAV